MIKKISNKTKELATSQKPFINIEENLNIIIEKNITIYAIFLTFLSILSTLVFYNIRKQRIDLSMI